MATIYMFIHSVQEPSVSRQAKYWYLGLHHSNVVNLYSLKTSWPPWFSYWTSRHVYYNVINI